jgi:hypothetical protein
MRRTLAIVAVVLGFGATMVVAVTMIQPSVTEPVPIPIRPTASPAQLERLQAEITADLLSDPALGGWLVGVEGGAVRVVLPPGATAVGRQLQEQHGALVRVSYEDLIGPAVTMLPPHSR